MEGVLGAAGRMASVRGNKPASSTAPSQARLGLAVGSSASTPTVFVTLVALTRPTGPPSRLSSARPANKGQAGSCEVAIANNGDTVGSRVRMAI